MEHQRWQNACRCSMHTIVPVSLAHATASVLAPLRRPCSSAMVHPPSQMHLRRGLPTCKPSTLTTTCHSPSIRANSNSFTIPIPCGKGVINRFTGPWRVAHATQMQSAVCNCFIMAKNTVARCRISIHATRMFVRHGRCSRSRSGDHRAFECTPISRASSPCKSSPTRRLFEKAALELVH